MSRPVHFEIHATEPQRCIRFYTELFGWTFTKWESPVDYWLIKTGEKGAPGIDGGMVPRRGDAPARMQAVNAYVCTTDVPDIDAAIKRIGEIGGTIALPKMPIPAVGWLAYAHDSEGNIFGVMQFDANAK